MEDTLNKAEELFYQIRRIDKEINLFRETEYDETGHKNDIGIHISDSSGNFRESFSVDDELKKHIREYYINKLQKEREKTREEIKKVLEELKDV